MKKILTIVLIGILLICICLSGCVNKEEEMRKQEEIRKQEEKRKREEIINAVKPLAKGTGAAEASSYKKNQGIHPVVIIDNSGNIHTWNKDLPEEWKPKSIEKTELVAVITKGEKSIQVCQYTGPSVTRYQNYIQIQLREAKTGNIVKTDTFYGSMPPQCKTRELYHVTAVYGTSISFDEFKPWLQKYVVL